MNYQEIQLYLNWITKKCKKNNEEIYEDLIKEVIISETETIEGL